MAAATTTYDIKVKYSLDDKASKGLDNMTRKSDMLGKAMTSVNKKLMFLGKAAAAAGAFGLFKLAKEGLNFNRMLQNTEQQLTTVIQRTQSFGREFSRNKAGELMRQLREDAKSTAGTFAEMTEFATAIAPAIGQAGGSVETIRKFAKLGIVGASAFGVRKDVAALDIRQALTRGVTARDPLTSLLGIDPTTFNKLGKAARLVELEKALDTEDIRAASKEFQKSFEGVFSTFKSNLQVFSGKALQSVFTALNEQLIALNKWFDDNQAKVAEMAKSLADGFKTAFTFAKSIFGFIVEHRELLLTLAQAFLVGKAVGALGRGGLAIQSMFSDVARSGLTAASKIGLMAGAAALAVFALKSLINFAEREQEKRTQKGVDADSLERLTRRGARGQLGSARAAVEDLTREGLLKKTGGIDVAKVAKFARERTMATRPELMFESQEIQKNAFRERTNMLLAQIKGTLETAREAEKLAALQNLHVQTQILNGILIASPVVAALENFTASLPSTKRRKGPTNVRMVVNVASDDPDRMAIALEDFFQSAAQNPAQAADALREG